MQVAVLRAPGEGAQDAAQVTIRDVGMEPVAVHDVQAERGHAVAHGLAGVHPGGDIDAQIGRQEGHRVASMLDRVELEFRVPGRIFRRCASVTQARSSGLMDPPPPLASFSRQS